MEPVFKTIARENFVRSGYIISPGRERRLPWTASMPSRSPLELSDAVGFALRHRGNRMSDPLRDKFFNLHAWIHAFIGRRD